MKISFKDFKNEVLTEMEKKPTEWRNGQFVFNYVNSNFGDVARIAQFKKGVDCFYNDEKIEPFLECCYSIISNIK